MGARRRDRKVGLARRKCYGQRRHTPTLSEYDPLQHQLLITHPLFDQVFRATTASPWVYSSVHPIIALPLPRPASVSMGKVADRRSKLAELKALRLAGKKAFDTYQVDDVQELYEEVDENQYKKIVRERLNEDDFVVDDNGEGYADDGREEWDRLPNEYASDSEEDLSAHGRPSKAGKQKCPTPDPGTYPDFA